MMTFMKKKQETGRRRRPRPPGLLCREPRPGDGGPEGRDRPPEVTRKILVVGKGPVFTAGVMDYAANLAERLGYDIIAMNLNPALDQAVKFFSPYNQRHAGQVRPAGPGGLGRALEPGLTARGSTASTW